MKIFLSLLLGTLCQFATAQIADKTKLDNFFNALEENDKFMGSVAVSQNNKIIYTKSIGYCDLEKEIKANEESKYRIGSISKTFTAVLVLKAVEENKLELSQTIDKYFPSIENADQITIEQLLRHRSGIHNFTNDKAYLTYNTQAKSEKEMIAVIAEAGSDFEADSKAEYSNSNYVLLSYILEKSLKQPFAELLNEHITAPLELTNTYFGKEINTANQECKSYKYIGNWNVESETNTSIPMGAGGVVSTPSDLVTFSDALFGGKLLKAESLALMKTIKDQYGIGLFQIPFYDKTGYGHTGGIDGFSSVFSHFADGNVSYALTSNGSNFNNNKISIAVLSAIYDKPYEIPEFSTFEVSSEDLDAYLGIYSSAQIPLKITITKENATLIAQATDQPSFPLDATEKDKFKYDQAGLVLEFNPSENSMLLIQGGKQFTYTKD
jgi:CubicO group peptidase (beta-lactamase class C family)